MNLGKKIFELRKNKHLSQEQVAEKLHVTRQTVSNWELGETSPDLNQAKELAKSYHLAKQYDSAIKVYDITCPAMQIEFTKQEKAVVKKKIEELNKRYTPKDYKYEK